MKTEDYYNQNAEKFVEQTFALDVLNVIHEFTKKLPPGARVLDVGCGSGRDTLTFKSLGYDVVAFDASEEIVKLASKKINHPIIHMKIEDMKWEEEFDGVWAMASLLHLPKSEMAFNLQKIMASLKPEGSFYLALKGGVGEGYDERGRFFSYYSEEEVKDVFNSLGYSNIEFFESEDSLSRDVTWISAIIKKEHQLNLKPKR